MLKPSVAVLVTSWGSFAAMVLHCYAWVLFPATAVAFGCGLTVNAPTYVDLGAR